MSTLSEFLLARIAEDEAATWTLVPYDCEPDCCAPAGWVGSQCRWCDPAPVYGGTVEAITNMAEEHAEAIHQRSRVLAECEAKRRIVEGHAETWELGRKDYLEGLWRSEDHAIRLLAAVYADHPDYRSEWRP